MVLLEAYFIPLNVLMVTMEVNQLRRIESDGEWNK